MDALHEDIGPVRPEADANVPGRRYGWVQEKRPIRWRRDGRAGVVTTQGRSDGPAGALPGIIGAVDIAFRHGLGRGMPSMKWRTDSAIEFTWPGVPVDSLGQHMAPEDRRRAGGKDHRPPAQMGLKAVPQQCVCACSSTTARRRFHMIWRRMAKTPLGVPVRLAAFRTGCSSRSCGAQAPLTADPDPLPLWGSRSGQKRTAVQSP